MQTITCWTSCLPLLKMASHGTAWTSVPPQDIRQAKENFSTRNRWVSVALLAALALLGQGEAQAQSRTSQSIQVQVNSPGSSAQEVETAITVPVEQALLGMAGIEQIISRSSSGQSTITLYLKPGQDLFRLRAQVADRLSQVRDRLPDASEIPGLFSPARTALPRYWLMVPEGTSPENQDRTRALTEKMFTVPGVEGKWLTSVGKPVLGVQIDADRLTARGLSIVDVAEAIRKEAFERGFRGFDTDSLGTLVLARRQDVPVLLRDVAKVSQTTQTPERRTWLDGKPVAAIGLQVSPVMTAREMLEKHLPKLLNGDDPLVKEAKPAEGIDLERQPGWVVEVKAPPGASQEQMARLLLEISKQLAPHKEIAHVLALAPLSEDRENVGVLLVQAKTSAEAIRRPIQEALLSVPGAMSRLLEPKALDRPLTRRSPLTLVLQGEDLTQMRESTQAIVRDLSESKRVGGFFIEDLDVGLEMRVRPDRERMARLGLRAGDVYPQIALLSGGPEAMIPVRRGLPVQLEVDGKREGSSKVERLRNMVLSTPGGQRIPLSTVATIEAISAPQAITRVNGKRALLIAVEPASGVTLQEAREVCRKIQAPEGCKLLLWTAKGGEPEELGKR